MDDAAGGTGALSVASAVAAGAIPQYGRVAGRRGRAGDCLRVCARAWSVPPPSATLVACRNTSDLWKRLEGGGLGSASLVEAHDDHDERGYVDPGVAVGVGAVEVALVNQGHQSRRRRPASGRPGQWSGRDGVGAVGATTRAPQRGHVQTLKRSPRAHRCPRHQAILPTSVAVAGTGTGSSIAHWKRRSLHLRRFACTARSEAQRSRIHLNDTAGTMPGSGQNLPGAGTTSIAETITGKRGATDDSYLSSRRAP